MAVTSGFFDGINHDRRYTAAQWGHIMDYLIMDGVYSYYPSTGVVYDDTGHRNKTMAPFKVTPIDGTDAWKVPNGYGVAVGPGRAWFDGTWTHITTPEIVELDPPDPAGDRIDCVCLQMNKSVPVRANRIVVKRAKLVYNNGTTNLAAYLPMVPAPGDEHFPRGTSGVDLGSYTTLKDYYPELQGSYMHNDEVHDVPLAYILRRKDSDRILSSDIYTAIGTQACPYVTNIADGTFSAEDIYQNWSTQFGDFWDEFQDKVEAEYEDWHTGLLALDPQWKGWLDNRSADFMRWLKQRDRAYHVWYQGAVNWTYEYIRNLQTENEDFERQWSDAIQKAQDLLEHGLTDYTQKIEEILKKFESIDNLVDDKMAEFQKEVDTAISELKTEIQNGAKEMISEVVTEQIGTIVNQVVEQAAPDIREALAAEVENMVKSEIDSSFEDRLADLEKRLEAYQQETLDSLNRRVDQVVNSYTDFQNKVETNIQQLVYDSLGDSEDLQAALEGVVDRQLQAAVLTALGNAKQEWTDAIKEDVSSQISSEVERIFSERFESEKADLLQYVKDQQKPITDAAVDERFNQDVSAQLTEAANGIKQELAAGLATEVSNKFDESFQGKYEELTGKLESDLGDIVDQRIGEKFDTAFADKQTELEGVIGQKVTEGVQSLDGKLTEAVEAKVSDMGQNIWDYVDLDALVAKLVENEKFKQEVPTAIDLSNYLERG